MGQCGCARRKKHVDVDLEAEEEPGSPKESWLGLEGGRARSRHNLSVRVTPAQQLASEPSRGGRARQSLALDPRPVKIVS